MRLRIFRSFWGLTDDHSRAHDLLPAIAASGYDGVVAPAMLIGDPGPFREALADTGLAFRPQVFTFGRDVDAHLGWYRRGLQHAKQYGAVRINAQIGYDGFDDEQSVAMFEGALRIEAEEEVDVDHETHRGRILFHPRVSLPIIERFPITLNADLSHWVCSAERLALNEMVLDLLCDRVRHIDARVGHEEGPQVPDPRAPQWAEHLAAHERWWDRIIDARRRAGDTEFTMAPEFGPPPYQPVAPYTGEPLADHNELNDWMAQRLRSRLVCE